MAPRAKRGPGVSQILGVSGFVNSKKKRKMPQFFPDFDVISKKKKRFSMFHKLICRCHFHGPPEVHGPPEACGLPDGPPKIYGPRVYCPPFQWPCLKATSAEAQERAIFLHCLFLSSRPSGGSSLGFRAGSL